MANNRKSSRRKVSVFNSSGERIRRISRSESAFCFNTDSEIILEESDSSSENIGWKPVNFMKQRKYGIMSNVPYFCAELTKRLSGKKHKTSKTGVASSTNNSLAKIQSNYNVTDILRVAIRENNVSRVSTILQKNTLCINKQSTSGITCLHEASFDGNLACIKLLVNYGADLSIQDKEGYTCLDYAVLTGHYDCASFLASNGVTTRNVRDGLLGLK